MHYYPPLPIPASTLGLLGTSNELSKKQDSYYQQRIGSQLTSVKLPTFSCCAPPSQSKPLPKMCCELKKEVAEGTKKCLLCPAKKSVLAKKLSWQQ